MIQKFFLFQMKILDISIIFSAKVRLEYQNILCWLFKKHHFQSICVTVSLQEHFQKIHFTFRHPVLTGSNMGFRYIYGSTGGRDVTLKAIAYRHSFDIFQLFYCTIFQHKYNIININYTVITFSLRADLAGVGNCKSSTSSSIALNCQPQEALYKKGL